MKEKYVSNEIRLSIATNCLKSKSLPPMKYPKEVVMYKFNSFLNQEFKFNMDEDIISPKIKLEPKAEVMVIGIGTDIYDFVISYLSNHEKGLLSIITVATRYIEESVFKALHAQSYFNHYLLTNDRATCLEKTHKSLEKFLSSSKRKKIYVFNDPNEEEAYRFILNAIDENAKGLCDIYMENKFEYEKKNKYIKLHELDLLHSLTEVATEAICSVNENSTVQIFGDNPVLPEMKRQLLKKNVKVPDIDSELQPNANSLICYNNSYELLSKYLNIARANRNAKVYVLDENVGALELIKEFLGEEDKGQLVPLDLRVLWKAYFASHMI